MDAESQPYASVDEYISRFPAEIQATLSQLRAIIKKAAPEATEKISYRMPTFWLNGNLVHFAAFKNHIGLYATPSGNEAFQEELKAYKTSKGAIQLPLDQPLPVDLIERMVKFRVEENKARPPSRRRTAQA